MIKRKLIFCIQFFFIGFCLFPCSHITSTGWCEVARVYMDDNLPEIVAGKRENGERIKGVVYFEGFCFPRT